MTPTQLKTAALRKMQVISPDMPVSSEDMAIMTEKYTGLHALLSRDVINWQLNDSIPAESSEALASILAAYAVNDFGIGEPRRSSLKAEGALFAPQMSPAELQLRRSIFGSFVHRPQRAEYF